MYIILYVTIAGSVSAVTAAPPDGLCVFDYDNTLTRGMGYWDYDSTWKTKGPTDVQCGGPLPMNIWWEYQGHRIYAGMYAAGAIKACELNNMRIGLASASSCPPSPDDDPSFVSRVTLLEKLGFPSEVAFGNALAGPAYMCLNSTVQNKAQMVQSLIAHYGVSANRTVFFDDYQEFLNDVTDATYGQPDVHTVLASSGSHGCNGQQIMCPSACGISKTEVAEGLYKALGRHPVMPQLPMDGYQAAATTSTHEFVIFS